MHWAVFVLVLLAYVFINMFELFPRGSELRTNIAVLLLVLPRGLLRLRKGRLPIAPALPCAVEWLSKLAHFALYAFLLVQPILGIVTLQAGGKAVKLFV